MLPLTNVFVFDVEGQGLECRWNPALPLYFVGVLKIDHMGRKNLHKFYDARQAIDYIEELLQLGWFGVAHNAKFDLCALNSRGLNRTVKKGELTFGCTMVMEYTRATNLPSYSLDALTGMKTDVVQTAIDKGLLTKDINKAGFWSIDWSNNSEMVAHIADYCCDDLKATWALYRKLAAWYNNPEHEKFRSALINLEFPMLSVLAHMEQVGIAVDESILSTLTSDVDKELKEHREVMSKVAVNMPKLQWKWDEYQPFIKEYVKGQHKSTKNISHYIDSDGVVAASEPYIVYDHCPLVNYNSNHATGHTYWLLKHQCPEVLDNCEFTDKGKPRLNKEFFADVAEQMPEHLPISKLLKSTKDLQICNTIAEHVRDGRIHGSFNNCLTRTGRLSSSQPNLQNISRSDKDPASIASRFRQVFAAPSEGKVILVADIDRIELCVLAWFLKVVMKDSRLADICNTPGSDVHQANADLWGVLRMVAKTLIFLIVYGGGANLILRRGMTKTIAEAEAMVKQVDDTDPNINKFKSIVWAKARERGYLTNPFNARCVYPELNSKRAWQRGRGERQSFNCLIQRTARDILHILAIDSLSVVQQYQAKIVNIVHDEMIVECNADVAEALTEALNKIWQKRTDLLPGVIINGDWHQGRDWYSAKG